MKLFRLFHVQVGMILIQTVLIIGVLSIVYNDNINVLLGQVKENINELTQQWQKEEITKIRRTIELEYNELNTDELNSLSSLLNSEQFLSVVWKQQYSSLTPFLNDPSKKHKIKQLLYINKLGEILAYSGQINMFNLALSKITPLDFKSKLLFSSDGTLLRMNKYPIINAFGDNLGSIISINPYKNILSHLNTFAQRTNIGLVFSYEGKVISRYGFPEEYTNLLATNIYRYNNLTIECQPIRNIYHNAITLCISKSIQLLLNLNQNISQEFQTSKNKTVQSTLFISFFIVAVIFITLLLFYRLFITPLNKIHLGFNQLGEKLHLPATKPSRIIEISQLHRSLNQIYRLFYENKKLSLKLKQDAAHDALTELPNRRFFREQCERSLAEAKRENKSVSLLLIDLDKFKAINDLLGHDCGDMLLCQIAQRLQKQIRSYDLLARWGGDEFVLLIPNLMQEYYDELIRKIKMVFEKPFILKGSNNYIDVSVGISTFPENGLTLTELLVAADIAMYRAKQIPGTQALLFHDLDADKIKRELTIEKELRQCISNNELTLHFQPIFHVEKRCISHAEALLRWNNSILGNVSPEEFIPIAERIGLIKDIGTWVRNAAFKQLQVWKTDYNKQPKITINTSPNELNDKNYSKTLIKELSEYDIDPKQITVEITESAIINDFSLVSQLLQELAEHNIAWALDDFGTGYSSLHYLTSLNPNYLKIDRSLIQDIEHSDRVKSLFNGIILLAQNLNIKIIAEGVETEKQYTILQNEHCDYFQGYWGSKPIDSESFINFFSKKHPLD